MPALDLCQLYILIYFNRKRQENPTIIVTADDVILRDLMNIQNQLQLSMFILTNDDDAVVSAEVVLEAIEVFVTQV